MSNLNKVMLIGRLGADPEIRYTQSGGAVANIRMATTEFWKDKQGNKQEKTEWHSVVAFGKLADLAQNYLKKGRLVYIEGRLQTRDWVDQQNVKHYRTEVVANSLQFLERMGEGQSQGQSRPQGQNQPPGQNQSQGQNAPPPQDDYYQNSPPNEGEGFVEDDIPF
ncbi:MAG: single-stranded DNA-binding protein [Deltaproteobacteria bacterium]|nr:single-stranded DNA-binding protein [Deltaproteobacteria bacterium]